MKKYLLSATLGMMAVLMFSVESHASAVSTTWKPTDGNVNVIKYFVGLPTLNGGDLALFESADDFSGPALVLGTDGGVFEFTDNLDGSFTVEGFVNNVSVGSILMDGNEFMLGVSWGGSPWRGDFLANQAIGDPTSYMVGFRNGRVNHGAVGLADVMIVPEIPLPASVLLFGSALAGLVAVKRRKAGK